MADSNTTSDDNKEKSKTSELAIASLLIPLSVFAAWPLLFLYLDLTSGINNEWAFRSNILFLPIAFVLAITLFLFASPVFALMSLVRIKKSNGLLKGRIPAHCGLVLSVICLGFLAWIRFFPYVVIVMMWREILELKLRGL